MILTPVPTLGTLALNTQFAVKFAYLERGVNYIKVTAHSADGNNANVTFYYDSTYTLVQKTDYLPTSLSCWFVDLTS